MDAQELTKMILSSPELLKQVEDLMKSKKFYDPDSLWNEEYYFYNFINEFITGNQFYGTAWKVKVDDELIPALLKVIRIVETGKDRYVILKTGFADRNNPIGDFITVLDLATFKRNYGITNGCYYTISHQSTKGGKMGEEKIWIFQTILENTLFRFRHMDWIPCTPLESKPSHKDIFNTFTGFKAKIIEIPDETIIKPILDHIKIVWANNMHNCYEYILNWLATAVQFPRKKIPVLVLAGEQGIGKTMPIEFLTKRVFGYHCTAALNNLDEALGNFNSILANKFMIYIAESEGTQHRDGQIWNKMNIFKSKVTDDRILIQPKYVNAYQASNFIHWIISTNHLDSLRLEPEDRRFAVFVGSEAYKGNATYFDNFFASLNDEMADHFYSYLIQLEITMDLKVIETDARKQIKDLSLPNPVRFWSDFISSEWTPTSLKVSIKPFACDESNYHVSKQDIYLLYKQWCTDTGNSPTNSDWFYRHLVKHKMSNETIQHDKTRCLKVDKKLIDSLMKTTKSSKLDYLKQDESCDSLTITTTSQRSGPPPKNENIMILAKCMGQALNIPDNAVGCLKIDEIYTNILNNGYQKSFETYNISLNEQIHQWTKERNIN